MNTANTGCAKLDEAARLFWMSKAHYNTDVYFGYKHMTPASNELPVTTSTDATFSKPKINIHHSVISNVLNFIRRFEI